MAGEPPIVCKSCETPLGPAEEEIAHPDDPDAPDDAHFKVQIREDGEERLQCTQTGQLAKPVGPADEGYPENLLPEGGGPPQPTDNSESDNGGGGQPQQSPTPDRSSRPSDGVYDLDEEKDQMDILQEVVSNPSYELNDDQINEIRAWAMDYNGQMPPDALEEIAGLMSGVQKQTAELMRQRYELKLNNWVRQKTSEDKGPGIGISRMPYAAGGQGGPQMPRPAESGPSQEAMEAVKAQEQSQSEPEPEPESSGEMGDIDSGMNRREERRKDRRKRRQQAVDDAMNELAVGTAENISEEAGEGLVRARNIMFKVLESKAEKDPEWFFELADRFDVDIMDLMEPSQARKQEMGSGGGKTQSQVDNEIDDALNGLDDDDGNSGGGGKGNVYKEGVTNEDVRAATARAEARANQRNQKPQQTQPQQTQQPNYEEVQDEQRHGRDEDKQEEESDSEEESFEEIFGG